MFLIRFACDRVSPWAGVLLVLLIALSFPVQARDSAYLKDQVVLAGDLVSFEELAPSKVFVEAVAPGVLGRACAENPAALREYYREQELRFDKGLVYRDSANRFCHVYYVPTFHGFRAQPKNAPVQALLFEFDATRLVVRGDEEIGDSLDVVRSLVKRLERPIPISIGVGRGLSPQLHEEARLRHFGGVKGLVALRDIGPGGYNPWVQDFIKSGRVGDQPKILVPRRLFEGVPANGPAFQANLDELCRQSPFFVRSNLSWEGGDLLFILDPKNHERLLLFYGEAAKPYWGRNLTPDEYAYVLKAEFGADEAVDLSALAAHVDYELAFLPEAGVALLGTHLNGNVVLAREALASLIARMPEPTPKELLELRRCLIQAEKDYSGSSGAVLKALRRAAEVRDKWRLVHPEEPGQEDGGTSLAGSITYEELDRLLAVDTEVTRAKVRAEYARRFDRQTIGAHLALVESQFLKTPEDVVERTRRSAEKLSAFGFQVIFVPRLGGHPDSIIPWSGHSHVNLLLVDQQLFVPRFGFGAEEDRLLDELARKLPERYEVIPIFAQHLLIHNGGLHCISGILR